MDTRATHRRRRQRGDVLQRRRCGGLPVGRTLDGDLLRVERKACTTLEAEGFELLLEVSAIGVPPDGE